MLRFVPLVLAVLLAACAAAPEEASSPREEPADVADDLAEDEPADREAPEDEAADDEPAAAGEGLTAVSSVFPLAWFATQVGPGAEVTFLGAGGADPHDLELSPGDRALLETADIVLYMGQLSFQPQVERAVEDAAGEVVDVRAHIGEGALIAWDHDHDEDGHSHDDDGDHSHDDDGDHSHDDDGDHEADEGMYDPHVWLDPAVMADVAIAVGAAFAAADEANAETYQASADQLRVELLELAAELDALLSGCRLDTAIVSHEAYAYLLEPRGLAQEGISGAGGHAEASPQRIADLTAKVQEQDVRAVLAEPVHGRDDAEALAREAGVELLEIDPLEVATPEHFERGYVELLREQGERFATALDCDGGVQ